MHPETDLMARRRMMVGGQERIGAVTDWKKLALEHQAEIGRLNLEASENERLWDALFQKVLITSHQLELDNQVLRAGFLGEPSAIEACKIIIATKHSAPEGKEAIIRRQREELQRLKIELSKRSKGEGVDVGYSSFSSTMAQDYDLMACAKLLDLWMDYDPEGLEDMQKIYLEIEKRPHPMDEQRISRLLVKDLQTDEGEDWQDKKKRMSERIKALFDDSVSLEKRRKRLRFERAAAVMWGMNPATNRKERALMESLWELDKERKNNNGTPLPSTLNVENVQAHKLFARLLESDASLAMLPSAIKTVAETNPMASATFRRKAYDHSLKLNDEIQRRKELTKTAKMSEHRFPRAHY